MVYPLGLTWPIYMSVILCGIVGLVLILVGLYFALYTFEPLVKGQIFFGFEGTIYGTKRIFLFSILAIALGMCNLIIGYQLFQLNNRVRSLFIMLFAFQALISVVTVIGSILFLIPLIKIISSKDIKELFLKENNGFV
ncbi:MAG: hypothetical protein ACXAB7_11070 [Candidatus Kariarchaeaceae archaeon]|jgi:hypothetical protein